MRVPRFYTTQALSSQQSLLLDDAPSHHVLKVLRLKKGDSLVLFNGDGNEYSAILESAEGKKARITIGTCSQPQRESPLRIELGQGMVRSERMELVLQKSVELGVHSITPLWTQRSQVKLQGARLDKKQQHWQAIVRSACEQCGRVYVPQLFPASNPDLWSEALEPGCVPLMFTPDAAIPLQALEPASHVRILIGPEGGLDDQEIELARMRGFQAVRLGPRILRTETAALAVISAIQTLWGDLAR